MRYVLIDYMHLAHRCVVADPLSVTLMINGELQVIDTTIPTYTIKGIYRYGGKGMFNTGVFLEGGNAYRKNYFAQRIDGVNDGEEYKQGRDKGTNSFFNGIDMTKDLLLKGNVSVYRVGGYEADDSIYNMILKIKATDTTTPIDVITNDSDLLPLVDEQVSVYIRGTREYSETGCPTHRLYYQVTPRSWLEYLSYTSAHKQFYIPYNSMLLFKLIRGDKADNVTGAIKGYGGKKYTELMKKMVEDGVDFPNIFRYGVDFDTVMRPVLLNYFEEDVVDKMKFIYGGIGLRKLEKGMSLALPKPASLMYMQEPLVPLKIHLK